MAHVTVDLELDPRDRLLAAIIKQAIADYQAGPPCPTQPAWIQGAKAEYYAARCFLEQLGLLDDAGELVRAAVADVTLVGLGD